jgi:two-component system chemotaxis response regulator CheY
MTAPHRVLLVEDDDGTREMFSLMLRDAGMDVVEAADGLVAFAVATDTSPDLVVTDIAMPRMDGLALTRALRNQAATQLLPIIAVTGEAAVFARARAAGCTAIVSKPYSPVDLVALVRYFIGRKHQSREADALLPWTDPPDDVRRGYGCVTAGISVTMVERSAGKYFRNTSCSTCGVTESMRCTRVRISPGLRSYICTVCNRPSQ